MENLLPRVVAGVDADFEAPALEGMRGRVTCVFVSAAVHLSCGNGGGVTAVNCHARTANMNTPARCGGVVPVHTFVARIVLWKYWMHEVIHELKFNACKI